MLQIEKVIEQMKVEFNKRDIVQKRVFLEKLKQKTVSSKNIEYINFLNDCIRDYNYEIKNNTTSLDKNVINSNLSHDSKKSTTINNSSIDRDEKNRHLKLEWIEKNKEVDKGIGDVYEFCANLCGVDKTLEILVGVVSGHAVKGYYTEADIAGNFIKGNILKILKSSNNRLKIEWLVTNRKIDKSIGEIYDFCASKYGTSKALDMLLEVENNEVVKKTDNFAYSKEIIIQDNIWELLSERENLLKLEWLEQNSILDKSVNRIYNFYTNRLGTTKALKSLLEVANNVVIKRQNSEAEFSDKFIGANLWESFEKEEKLLKLELVKTLDKVDKRAFDYYKEQCGEDKALKELLETDGKSVSIKTEGEVKVNGRRVKGNLWTLFRGREKLLKLDWIEENRTEDKDISEIYDFCLEKCGKTKTLEALLDIEDGVIVKNTNSEITLDKITFKGDLWKELKDYQKKNDLLKTKWMSNISKLDKKVYNYYKAKYGEEGLLDQLLDVNGKSAAKKSNGQVVIDGVKVKGNLWTLFTQQERKLKLEWIKENKSQDRSIEKVFNFCVKKCGEDKALEVLLELQDDSIVKNLNSEIIIDGVTIKGNLWKKIDDYEEDINTLKLNWIETISSNDKKVYNYYKAKCGMKKALDELVSITGKTGTKKFSGELNIDGVNLRGNLWILFKAKEKSMKVEWIEKNRGIDEKIEEVFDYCMRKCGKDKTLEALLEMQDDIIVKSLNSKIIIDDITIEGDLWKEIEEYSRKEIEASRRKKARKAITREKRIEIFERDGYRCVICGASAKTGTTLEIDHKIPISKGGTSEDENLQTLCFECNSGKGSRILKEA